MEDYIPCDTCGDEADYYDELWKEWCCNICEGNLIDDEPSLLSGLEWAKIYWGEARIIK
jgi:hypothetical protein